MAPLDVLGFGGMVVDRIHRADRIAAAEQKTSVSSVEVRAGGCVANHLSWTARLGLRSGILGLGGDDPDGRWLRAALRSAGIDPALVRPCAHPTSVSEIFVDPAGARAIYMRMGVAGRTTAGDIRTHWAEAVRAAPCVTSEIGQMDLAAVEAFLAIAREAVRATFVDFDLPAPQVTGPMGLGTWETLEAVLRRATVLKGAPDALCEWAGVADPRAAVGALLDRYRPHGMRWVLSTMGSGGCAYAGEGVPSAVLAAFPGVRVVDSTGAGDAFLGGVVAAFRRGMPLPDAARLASACGAACCEAIGGVADAQSIGRVRARCPLPWLPSPADASPSAPVASPLQFARRALDVAARSVAALADAARSGEGGGTGANPLAQGMRRLVERLDEALERGGRIHFAGIGKPGNVARKAGATLASLGIPAYFLNPVDALHGDSGQVVSGDAVVLISHSGRTDEMVRLAVHLRSRGIWSAAVTAAAGSPLASSCDLAVVYPFFEEGDPVRKAPMASVLAAQALLDALGAELSGRRGIDEAAFRRFHPAGALGESRAQGGA